MMQKLKLNYDENHYNGHKSYIRNWIDILKNQPSELFKAIKDADQIVNYIEEQSLRKDKTYSDLDEEKEMEIEYE